MQTMQIEGRELNVREASTGFYLRVLEYLDKLSSEKMTVDELCRGSVALIWECVGTDDERKPAEINPGLTIKWVQDHVRFRSAAEAFDAIRAAGIPIVTGTEKQQGESLAQ